jgi:hypothetical protein
MTNSLAGNSSSNLAVPVVPAAGTAGTQPGPFTVTVDPTLGETNTANNGPANMTPTTPVSAVGTAPTITSGSSVSIPENTTVVTTVMAGGTAPITYSIVGGADGALFTIDENTGALSFNTAPDFENATDANTDGVYEVTVRASNSAGNDAQTITVAVTDAAESSTVLVPVKAILQGAYDSQSGLMRDNLRSLPDFPLTSPYGGGETTTAGVLGISGNDAIVDWVLVELRDSSLPTTLVTSQAALLQADGDILAVDGTGTLTFTVTGSDYFVAIRHRNHLGVMTTGPVTLSASTPLVDFTMMADGSTYGSNSQKLVVDRYALWMGDLNGDNQIIGVGPNNDKNGILATVLAAPDNVNHNQNYIVTGYDASDSNLDGLMIAAGPNNDVNLIMYNVFIHPLNSNTAANFIVNGQLPMITP